jgi:RNA polymerase sigma-70 factor, ECF subfamily
MDSTARALKSSLGGTAARAESDRQSARVHRALEALPAHERTVIELAYWSGLSLSEVASSLNIPPATTRTRIRSALGRLAVVLEGDEP